MNELPPLRIREADGDPNAIPVFDIILSDNLGLVRRGGATVALTVTTGGGGSSVIYAQSENSYVVISLNTNLTAERTLAIGRGLALADSGANAAVTLYIPTPLDVSSGGTSASTFTNRGILIGSGISAIQALSALNSGELVVGSSTIIAPQILGAGSQGQVLVTDTAARTVARWAKGPTFAQVSVQAGDTIANTSGLVNFATTHIIPPDTILTGRVLRVCARGTYGTKAPAVGNFYLQLNVGAVILGSMDNATLLSGSITNRGWTMDSDVIFTTTGATAAVETAGTTPFSGSGVSNMVNGGTVAVDTTSAMVLRLIANWTTNDAANTITMRQLTVTHDEAGVA